MKLELTPNGVQLKLDSVPGTVLVPQHIRVGNMMLIEHILMFGPGQVQTVIDWLKNASSILEQYQEAIAAGMAPLPTAPVAQVSVQDAPASDTFEAVGRIPRPDTLPSLTAVALTDDQVAAYIATHNDPEALLKLASEKIEFIGPIQLDAEGNRVLPPPP